HSAGGDHIETPARQQLRERARRRLMVLDDEHAATRLNGVSLGAHRRLDHGLAKPGERVARPPRLRELVIQRQRQLDMKRRPLVAALARRVDRTGMQLDDHAGDREPQTKTSEPMGLRALGMLALRERLEDAPKRSEERRVGKEWGSRWTT